MSRRIFFFNLFIISLLLTSQVIATSIKPPKHQFSYSPGSEYTFSFQVDHSGPIEVGVEGNLAEYVQDLQAVPKTEGGSIYELKGKIVLPENLTPGRKEARVFVTTPVPERQYGQKSASVSARSRIIVPVFTFVPTPGKFIEILKFNADIFAKKNSLSFYEVLVKSIGEENIDEISGRIEFLTSQNYSVPLTKAVNVNTNSEVKLLAEWQPPEELDYGNYPLHVIVTYDGNEVKLTDRRFTYGSKTLLIKEIIPLKIQAGTINAVNVMVNSVWNEPLEFVAKFDLLDSNNQEVGINGESPVIKVETQGSATATWYLDAKNLKVEEKFKGRVQIEVNGGENTEKIFNLEVVESAPESLAGDAIATGKERFNLTTLAIIILIILALIGAIIWFRNRPEEI